MEILSNFAKVIRVLSGRAGIGAQAVWLQNPGAVSNGAGHLARVSPHENREETEDPSIKHPRPHSQRQVQDPNQVTCPWSVREQS